MAEPSRPATPWRTGTLGRGRRARVLFGWSYEDERVELAAFGAARPDADRVCVIAAAGETAAACAAAGFAVTAVDINPRQLDYARTRLDGAPAQTGVVERAMTVGRAVLARVAPVWRSAAVVEALDGVDPADAQTYWHDVLDRRPFPVLLRGLIGPGGLVLRALNPRLAAAVPPRFDRVIRDRIGAGLGRHGFTCNRFAWRLLAGRELPGWRIPVADPGVGSVELVQADVAEHLEGVPAGHYAGISLSNVLDGAGPEFVARLRAAAEHAVVPGGAIVLRSFADGAVDHPDASLLWGTVEITRPG